MSDNRNKNFKSVTKLLLYRDYRDDWIPGITLCYPRAISLLNIGRNINNLLSDDIKNVWLNKLGKDSSFINDMEVNDIDKFNKHFDKLLDVQDEKSVAYLKHAINEIIGNETNKYGFVEQMSMFDVIYLMFKGFINMESIVSPKDIQRNLSNC